jgi:hypothetical protein
VLEHDGFRSEAYCAVVLFICYRSLLCWFSGGLSDGYALQWTVLLSVSSPPESFLLDGFALKLFVSHTVIGGCECVVTVMRLLPVLLCSVAVVPVFVSPSSCVRCIVVVILRNLKVPCSSKGQSFESQQSLPEKGASLLIYSLLVTALHTTNQAFPSAPRKPKELSPLPQYSWARDDEPSLHHCAVKSDALLGYSTGIGLSADGGLRLRGELC